ncbi:glycosyltransferase family 9 protein [Seonamhaeicola algicola]|uniref:Glycosyltransferase family 9 protein n=1 Tax=Seonamhaeicola algicola TaxID=1719036 RepID=A0A5C7AT45_9FLAO|nr:glycosyltransferase family 9 protein [Seonamhaeicola algicola]TXE11561.1 glycosyltransferase family 9 protein [Seonamhaeicola algicola]
MSFKKAINSLRFKVMGRLTKNVGKSYTTPNTPLTSTSQIKKILISRPNHKLGNQLLLTPLIQELNNTFPNSKIDLFVKGSIARVVYKNYKQINTIIELPRKPFNQLIKYGFTWLKLKKTKYDLVINVDKNSSSGKLSTKFARSTYKLFGDVDAQIINNFDDYEHLSKYPIYNLRLYLQLLGLPKNNTDVPVLDIKLTNSEIEKGKEILNNITKNNKPTICIYTNATGNKCYDEIWWNTLYKRLLNEFPNHNIIEMLPVENISRINFKAPHFYSKDIREMGGVLNNTAAFIAADNGVMHLASASLTPTVGFFKTTNEAIYAPYGNGSFAINTNNTNIDNWIASIKNLLDKTT